MRFWFVILGIIAAIMSLHYWNIRYLLASAVFFGLYFYLKKIDNLKLSKFKKENKSLKYKKIFSEDEIA